MSDAGVSDVVDIFAIVVRLPWTKLPKTLLPVCSRGCPTTICRKRWRPSRLCSITSSENRLVKTCQKDSAKLPIRPPGMCGSRCSHLPWQRWNGDSRTLALKDIAEVLEVRVTAADHRVAQLKGWDVGSGVDLVRGVHVPWGGAVGLGILDLFVKGALVSWGMRQKDWRGIDVAVEPSECAR